MAALTQQSQPYVVWNTAFAVLVAIAGVAVAPRALAADPPGEKELAKGAAAKSAMGDGSDNELIGLLRPAGPEGAKQVNGDAAAKPKTGQ